MINRQPPLGVTNNPLVNSPFSQESAVVGSAPPPVADLWLLLDGTNFKTLEGPDLAFLG